MDGSNGKLIELLERIAGNIEETNRRLDETRAELRSEMRDGFAGVHTRLDNVIKIAGAHHTDHEERIRALENQVFKKSG
jgi:hypothetical protein